MIIDVFIKYDGTISLKTKTGLEVTKAFQHMWRTQSLPQKLWTDKGKEFYNKSMKDLLHKHNVYLYSTENEERSCGGMEPYNQTKHVGIFQCKQHDELHPHSPKFNKEIQ